MVQSGDTKWRVKSERRTLGITGRVEPGGNSSGPGLGCRELNNIELKTLPLNWGFWGVGAPLYLSGKLAVPCRIPL